MIFRVYWLPNLCDRLGVKVTPEVRSLLMSHWAWEGGNGGPHGTVRIAAKFNWLNTMYKWPHSTDFNDVGVQSYASYEDGLAATTATFMLPKYDGYRKSLKSGIPLHPAYIPSVTEALSTWVSGSSHSPGGLRYAANVIDKAKHDLPLYQLGKL